MWFTQIFDPYFKYALPHSLSLLEKPPPQCSFKYEVKLNIADRSVLKPHPILPTAGHSYDSNKMVT